MLKELQLRKIDMSDEIFVTNKNGYIGESTRTEIAYAESRNKKVTSLKHLELLYHLKKGARKQATEW